MEFNTIEASNLPQGWDEECISSFFNIYCLDHGQVAECSIPNPNPMNKTTAIVKFTTSAAAKCIYMRLSNKTVEGLPEPVAIKIHSDSSQLAAAGGKGGCFGKATGESIMSQGPYGAALQAAAGLQGAWNPLMANLNTMMTPAEKKAEPEISDNIYVQNLPANSTEVSVMEIFRQFGQVVSVKVMSRGPDIPCAGLIRFTTTEAAKSVKDLWNGQQPEGFEKELVVKFANNKPGKGAPFAVKGGFGDGGLQQGDGGWQGAKGGFQGAAAPAQAAQGDWQQTMQNMMATMMATMAGSQSSGPIALGSPSGPWTADTLVNSVYESGALPGGTAPLEEATVSISGLPADTTVSHLFKLFSPFGAIKGGSVDGDGFSWATGIVNFLDAKHADAAIAAYNGMQLQGFGAIRCVKGSQPMQQAGNAGSLLQLQNNGGVAPQLQNNGGVPPQLQNLQSMMQSMGMGMGQW